VSPDEAPPAEDRAAEEEPEGAKLEPSEAPPKIVKKRKRKGKIIMEQVPEADEEKLLLEITDLLKRARVALVNKNYLEAVKNYQDAAISANMAGDTERERIFLRRAGEILRDHPEVMEEEGFKLIKKRKLKARLREPEKFSLGRLISQVFLAGILIIFVYLGLFGAIFLQEIFEEGGSYSIPSLWGISIGVMVIGLLLAYLFATRALRWTD